MQAVEYKGSNKFMSKLIHLNFGILAVVAIVSNLGNAQAMTPNSTSDSAQYLVADLPTTLPPPNLLRNSRTRVTVPPLYRPEAMQTPANKKPGNLPRQTPTRQTIPARETQTTLTDSVDAPPVIEFGQPLPQRKG